MQKKKILFMAFILFLSCLGQIFAASCGDVNTNGNVDVLDALMTAQYVVGLNPPNFDSTVADVNGDNSISIIDALQVAQFYVGLIPGLSCPGETPPPTPTTVCTPAATPIPVNVSNQGSAYTGPHRVVVEQDPDLFEYTIYRPADLGDTRYPIVAWGEGACSKNGTSYPEFLSEIASHGYLVIADGAPDGTGSGSMGTDGTALLRAIDWAIAENRRSCSRYFQKLNPDRIAVMGHSCGGLMAIGAAGDPRISTVVLMNSGLLDRDQQIYNSLHTPVAIVDGGPEDMAYPNGLADFQAINTVPVIFANLNVGHGGTYFDDNGGQYARFSVAWLGWHLLDEEGATGKGMFVGSNCGLCNTSWDLRLKNLH